MTSPNVFKIAIMLEEVGLPWEAVHVNVVKGDQYQSDFLARNPNNKVPVIVDSEGFGGQPFTVFESGAILIYLAEKTGQLLSREPAERSTQLQWLMVQMSSVGPMFGQLNHFLRYDPPNSDYSRSRYATEQMRIFDVLERRLSRVPFLGGASFSIADVALFPWMRVPLLYTPAFKGKEAAEAYAPYPGVLRWFLTVGARPGVTRGIKALEAAVRPQDQAAFDAATPDDLDRFVGRGKYSRA
jgi:GST-like protein